MSFAKKQTAVCHSSIESEIIALEEAVLTEGLPILTFWETVVSILFSRPAIAPIASTATRSFPKQTFYSPLPSPASEIHNRDHVRRPVRGGGGANLACNIFSMAGELMSIIPFRFDHVENFFAIREFSSWVDLIIAEDNEATIFFFSRDAPRSFATSIGPTESTWNGFTRFLQVPTIDAD